jgi:hypothetical protein
MEKLAMSEMMMGRMTVQIHECTRNMDNPFLQ